MFENIMNIFKKIGKKQNVNNSNSKEAAKERLHLVLMQDRANVSADFLELMKQEIIEVIKKYIDVDESAIDVRLTNKENSDGTNGAPALYANIPILNIKNEARKSNVKTEKKEENIDKIEENVEKKIEEKKEEEAEQKVEQAEIIIEEVNAKKDDVEDKKEQEEVVVETKEKIKSENN